MHKSSDTGQSKQSRFWEQANFFTGFDELLNDVTTASFLTVRLSFLEIIRNVHQFKVKLKKKKTKFAFFAYCSLTRALKLGNENLSVPKNSTSMLLVGLLWKFLCLMLISYKCFRFLLYLWIDLKNSLVLLTKFMLNYTRLTRLGCFCFHFLKCPLLTFVWYIENEPRRFAQNFEISWNNVRTVAVPYY